MPESTQKPWSYYRYRNIDLLRKKEVILFWAKTTYCLLHRGVEEHYIHSNKLQEYVLIFINNCDNGV